MRLVYKDKNTIIYNMNDQSKQGDAANPDKAIADAKAAVATAGASLAAQGDFVQKIVEKIKASENILIALSRNPSVDEIAAAIGLSLFLDGMQKHTTAIYSGATPDALAFLRPDATFETNTASLQDFIIALNKDKADHLRYKLDGDFVKVFITPYRTSITEDDLTFSQGDYNVDFVIALNVKSAGDLDEALAEHGRIMHDAATVDITTGPAGRFGEIEWSNPMASSVCEMVTELIFALQGNSDRLDSEIATALLTGIVAATDRFSNNRTSPETLTLASKLMTMGADQQLITANVAGNEIVQNRPEGPSAADIATAVAADAGAFVETPTVGVAMGGVGVANAYAGGAAGSASASVGAPSGVPSGVPDVSGQSLVGYRDRGDGLTAAEIAARAGITNPTPSMPIDAAGTVVAPVLPQVATNGASVSGGVGDPSVMTLPGVNAPAISPAKSALGPMGTGSSSTGASGMGSSNMGPGAVLSEAPKEMATAEPTRASAPAVGVKMEPPAPSQEPTVDYGQMMEQALADPTGAPAMKQVLPPLVGSDDAGMPNGSGATGMTMTDVNAGASGAGAGAMQAGKSAAGADAAGVAQGNPAAQGAPAEMPGEPVANPFNLTLPPPPAPMVGSDMMPPAMPGAK